ncbi:MAG: hypothetical protein HZB91_13230 [Elusimicrobia bacterium]|nr:hypothetical protein [Elusimicrobiota bacterium]
MAWRKLSRLFCGLCCSLLLPQAAGAAVEEEFDVSLNPGIIYPFLDSQGAIRKSFALGLAADWWFVDFLSIGMELQQVLGHKVPATPKALFRPDPMLDWDRAQRDLRALLNKENQGYTISPDFSGNLVRKGFYFAPNLKFGKSVDGFRSVQRYYVSLGAGMYHNELTGSLSFKGSYADGSAFSKTLRIERVRREDLGVSIGVGFLMHGIDSRFVWGMDLRYYRIMRDNYPPDIFLSPSFRFGRKF